MTYEPTCSGRYFILFYFLQNVNMDVKRPRGSREGATNQFCFGSCFSAAPQRPWTQRRGTTWSPSCPVIGLRCQGRLAGSPRPPQSWKQLAGLGSATERFSGLQQRPLIGLVLAERPRSVLATVRSGRHSPSSPPPQ